MIISYHDKSRKRKNKKLTKKLSIFNAYINFCHLKVSNFRVDTNTTIAAVGSTGNSTGNHLHLEIRKDGVALNPQKYLYK